MSSPHLLRDTNTTSSSIDSVGQEPPFHVLSSRSPSPSHRRKRVTPSSNVIKDPASPALVPSSDPPGDEQEDEDNNVVDNNNAEEDDMDEDKSGTATYLTANCVVYTSYIGEADRVVDEHFSRALSAEKNKTLPLSQRNFPPSFWNSEYIQPLHPHQSQGLVPPLSSLGHFGHSGGDPGGSAYGAAASSADPYANPAFLAANDTWTNYMSSYHHHHSQAAMGRGMHDVYSSRLNPNYSSLLLGSSVSERSSPSQSSSSHTAPRSSSSSSSSASSSRKLQQQQQHLEHTASMAAAAWTSSHQGGSQHHATQLVVDNYNSTTAAAAAAAASATSSTSPHSAHHTHPHHPHHHPHHPHHHTHYNPMGLDGSMQSSSKDLYWF